MIHREMVMLQFRRYVKRFDQNEDAVQLKYAHSLRVSALCEEIADSLGLSAADRDVAWLIGVLLDIGRFEQLRTYHTFVDYRSMDHAKYGVKYSQSISPVVMEQARQKKLVRTQDKKKYIDFYVGALCLYFDLNYPRSRQLAWQQGYYSKLLSFHSENPASERALHEIRQLVHSTI